VPHMARARLVSARGSILTSLPSTLAATSLCSATASAPLGPFTLTTSPSTLAVTPEGIATGFFPTRDMAAGPLGGCWNDRSAVMHGRGLHRDSGSFVSYQKTVQRISPPTLLSRAS